MSDAVVNLLRQWRCAVPDNSEARKFTIECSSSNCFQITLSWKDPDFEWKERTVQTEWSLDLLYCAYSCLQKFFSMRPKGCM